MTRLIFCRREWFCGKVFPPAPAWRPWRCRNPGLLGRAENHARSRPPRTRRNPRLAGGQQFLRRFHAANSREKINAKTQRNKDAKEFSPRFGSAVSQPRRFLRRFFRSADSFVRGLLGSGMELADKVVRAPLVAASAVPWVFVPVS